MDNALVAAVARRLDAAFGEDAAIYTEDVPQGFSVPCFCIRTPGVGTRRLLGTRKRLLRTVDVLYFPVSETEPTGEIRTVLGRLLEDMEYLELADGPIRGTGLRAEIADGVGHLLANYNITVYRQQPDPDLMERLEWMPDTK